MPRHEVEASSAMNDVARSAVSSDHRALKARTKATIVDCALTRRIPRKFASFLIRVLGLKKA